MPDSVLEWFATPIRLWFEQTFDAPTPPQKLGWPAIHRGDHTLLLAPTGSGKTLAAFLSGIDRLFAELQVKPSPPAGVRIVYVSPLKALNNDIYRNLRWPLVCIRKLCHDMGIPFPEIRLAVRSGDTPPHDRQAMLRRPPHILITTPESLYLLLGSPRAREMFCQVHTVIVDEIHTMVGDKRGVHLALSLERLQALTESHLQRIGLSATIRPLEEAAAWLGGQMWMGEEVISPRPVTVIDAGYRKPLDLKVVTVVPDFHEMPGSSIWPSLIPELVRLIREHRSTLIFCNNRRLAERTADRLNEYIAAEERGEPNPLLRDGVARGGGIFALGTGTTSRPIRAHHGSVSREPRLEMEAQLKAGELPALVATSSLELGIDIGAIDLVVQLQSPKSIAQGLQRIGRSGHLVGQTAVGRLFPTFRGEVLETAAVVGGMLRGEVEPMYTPRNPLDVLAQQIVAMVGVESWNVDALYRLVRQAYPYRDLPRNAFNATLEMLAGRYEQIAPRELRPRLAWDRVHNRLHTLPGSRRIALTNGGTIPDRGTFGAYLTDGKTKIGELDEEFVYETRVGDVFILGSQVWRVVEVTDDRVMVVPAPGETPRMPFWHGDYPWRAYELGREIGAFRRRVAERLRESSAGPPFRSMLDLRTTGVMPPIIDWLKNEYALDDHSAWHIIDDVAEQLDTFGTVSSDRTIIVEAFESDLGEPRIVVHSSFGGRVNGPWGVALADALRERTGIDLEVQSNDDGLLLRFNDTLAQFPGDLVARMGPEEARERLLRGLPGSPLFGARFRQNAARALLLPGNRPGKRTPFWLQRLRARDLLQAVGQTEDFPILIETYRDCLEDVMDLPHLEEVLRGIQRGEIEIVPVETLTPSPVAQKLLRQFVNVYLYEWDTPKAERQLGQLTLDRVLLQDLLKDVALDTLLRPEAIDEVTSRLQHTAPTARARTVDELALIIEQLGDLTDAEIAERSAVDPVPWLEALAAEGRIKRFALQTAHGPTMRWVSADRYPDYEDAGLSLVSSPALHTEKDDGKAKAILRRFLWNSGPMTLSEILDRYAFDPAWLRAELNRLVEAGEVARGRFRAGDQETQYLDRRNLEQIHRTTLAVLRREVQPVPQRVYADFLADWQHLSPGHQLHGREALAQVLEQLRAFPVVGRLWERDILPLRLGSYDPRELEGLCASGEVVWVASGGDDPRRARVRFVFRGEGGTYLPPLIVNPEALSSSTRAVYELLKSEGALFFADIAGALDLNTAAIEAALIELTTAGYVTNDSLQTMRRLVHFGAAEVSAEGHLPRGPWSTLEAQLIERRGGLRVPEIGRRPPRWQWREARRRIAERVKWGGVRWTGRWSLVDRLGIMGHPLTDEERAGQQARQLLWRWGVVTRDVLKVEEGAWNWAAIYAQLRLMEMRGEVRRGYFVEGLPGAQFALPEAVEQLRARRSRGRDPNELPVVMNAGDPANLYGPAAPDGPLTSAGEPLTFARHPSTWVAQWEGWPILVARGGGVSLTTARDVSPELLCRALEALLAHWARSRSHITVEIWNGQPVLESEGRELLTAVGFLRDYPHMTSTKKR